MALLNNSKIISDLTLGKGFVIGSSITSVDFDEIWKYVRVSFSENFSLKYIPNKEEIINFHKLEKEVYKKLNLSVLDRTLKKEVAAKLSTHPWLNEICRKLNLVPADVHGIGHPTFTWRFTRPNSNLDFRPLHRDSWFRTVNKEPKIIDKSKSPLIQTVKIWIALNVVPGKSGLLVAPHSQKSKKPSYSIVKSDGYLKPLIEQNDLTQELEYAITPTGSFIVFGEDLLHGGAPNISDQCRVSLEIPLAPFGYKAFPYSKY